MVQNKLKSLGIVFENCENVSIDSENIGLFYSGDMCSTYQYFPVDKSMVETKVSNCIVLGIKKEANKEMGFDKKKCFERILMRNDITHIILNFETESTEICTCWEEDKSMNGNNSYQVSFVDDTDGTMYIIISKDKNVTVDQIVYGR